MFPSRPPEIYMWLISGGLSCEQCNLPLRIGLQADWKSDWSRSSLKEILTMLATVSTQWKGVF